MSELACLEGETSSSSHIGFPSTPERFMFAQVVYSLEKKATQEGKCNKETQKSAIPIKLGLTFTYIRRMMAYKNDVMLVFPRKRCDLDLRLSETAMRIIGESRETKITLESSCAAARLT